MFRYLSLLFLFSKSVPLLSSQVYHIVLIQNDLCHEEPCLTLFHLANNFSNYLHSNTSFILLPGNHTLENELTIINVSQLSLNSSTTHATQTRVLCDQFGLLSFHNVERLYVVDLEFVGCSISFLSVHQVILQGSSFVNAYNGTAMELVNSSVIIFNSAFYFNSFGSYRDDHRAGGAIFSIKSNISLSRTLFHGNSAEFGGAIYVVSSNLTIANSTYAENFASCLLNGAVSWCSDSDVNIHFGGVLCSYFSTIIIYSSKFLFNSAKSNQVTGHGGVLAAFYGVVSIHDSIFMHNRAEGIGGAITVFRVTLNIDQSEFYNNIATTGGMLNIERSYVTSSSNDFRLNSATLNGGIIYSTRSYIACR